MNLEPADERVDLPKREKFANALLDAAAETGAELSVAFVNDDAIQALNFEYRNINAPTDVLSFSMREGEACGQSGLLGDIIISVETAQRQADALGHSLSDELDELLFHGMVHLLGGDHDSGENRTRWFDIETQLQYELRKRKQTYQPKGLAIYEKTIETETGESAPRHAAADQL